MKNNLEQLVEKVLINYFSSSIEKYLTEAGAPVTQLSIPAMATSPTAAGMTLGPNTRLDISQPKDMKKLFRVIKTTPLVYNLIQLGLIDPEQFMPQEQPEQEGEQSDVTSQPQQVNTAQRIDV